MEGNVISEGPKSVQDHQVVPGEGLQLQVTNGKRATMRKLLVQ